MSRLYGLVRAVAQASKTVLASMAPIGAFDLSPFHQQSVRLATSRAGAAADTSVRGEHDFSHEEAADEQIKNRKERYKIQDGQGPEEFVEIIPREPEGVPQEKPVETPLRFSFGPGNDPVGVPCGEGRMKGRYIHGHIKTHGPFLTIPFADQDERGEK